MMTFTYPAVVFQNQYGYNFCFPDLDYLGITGKTYDYALNFAKEDMRAYIIQQLAAHQPLNEPTKLEDVNIEEVENKLALNFTVEKATKENVTVEID